MSPGLQIAGARGAGRTHRTGAAPAQTAPSTAPGGAAAGGTPRATARSTVGPGSITSAELGRLASNLELQLRAGVGLVRALEVQVDEDNEDTSAGRLIRVLVADLYAGRTLADSCADQPALPPLFASMVRAGEASGRLPDVLAATGRHLAWTAAITKSVRKALTYPILVLVACGGLLMLILGFLMPSFEPLFERVDDQLPAPSQWLRAAGQLVSGHWLTILIGIGAGVAGLITLARLPAGVRLLMAVAERLPGISSILFEIDMARFLRNLAVLLDAGIPLAQALQLVVDSVSTLSLQRGVAIIRTELEHGSTFREGAKRAELLSSLTNNLIAVGEESGSLPEMLDHAATYHATHFQERVDKALAMLEPAITMILGLIVGGIAMTIITTLYKAILLAGR